MPFLPPNQQRQSTEGWSLEDDTVIHLVYIPTLFPKAACDLTGSQGVEPPVLQLINSLLISGSPGGLE